MKSYDLKRGMFKQPPWIIISLLALSLFFVGTALAFTWEGELDPNDFDNWKVISVQPTPQGLVWMFAKNPDQASPIEIVAMAVDSNFTLVSYRYFKYGQPYSYVFDINQDKYVRHYFTEEQKRSCMQCHKNKIVPSASI